MPESLVKGSSSDLLSKLEPTVTSIARPAVDFLLQARADVQRDSELQKLFHDFQVFRGTPMQDTAVSALADQVAARLTGIWGGNFADALEAARYLADEFSQLGEGIHIVSSETGKVIAKLDENDLYQPAPVLRESGELAVPLPRIEPGMESLIVSWVFEKDREARILATLTERAHQTALLREEGDHRLWIATRNGRARIARSLGEDHPRTLLERVGGTAGAFLSHFKLAFEPPEGVQGHRYHLEMSSALRVNDPLTTNLSYDRLGSLRGVMAQGWVRELARQISTTLHLAIPLGAHPIHIDELTKAQLQTSEMWVMDPEVMLQVLRKAPKATILPANGAYTIGLKGKIGTIVLPETFQLSNRETFGRWEVRGGLDVEVFIPDWHAITAAEIRGVAPHTEVLR